MQRYLGLERRQQEQLSDEEWVERAAEALWLHEQLSVQVQRGIVEALKATSGEH